MGNHVPTIRRFLPLRFLAAIVAYCGFLFYLSSTPSLPHVGMYGFDKLVHFCLFGGLSATVFVGLHRAEHEYSAPMLFLAPVGFSIVYGLSDEAHQLFLASRSFDFWDIAADALGAATAAAVLLLVRNRRGSTKGGRR